MIDALIVDAERLLSQFLLSRTELDVLVADRIYTVLPNNPTFPAVRITRWGGNPVFSKPLYLDEAFLQVDAFGGGKRQAWTIAETCRAVMRDGLVGSHADGVVSWLRFGQLSYAPDDSFIPARERYMFTAFVRTHP